MAYRGGANRANMTKIYIGDLSTSGNEEEIRESFLRYGSVHEVWVARNPPGFAFVYMEDFRDAEDAVRKLDGRTLCGQRVRVEVAKTRERPRQRRYEDDGPAPDTVIHSQHSRRRRSRSRSPPRRRRSPSRSPSPYRRRRQPSRSVSRSPVRRRSRDRSPTP
ncbi:serine/arginine-rich splicing factor 3-like isoform X1 [Sycon ciliatum]|uniref:serine/arginine-rich splicing factor 3-like isoform X1 n=1 Tax=Sycon ciliatum TaxID=27933 RepID=UPI0020A8E362|eukprot:scpid95777/ scgid29977/ Serine/arginine-rich splicing factor 3; Pre-mRNA-splicing factor SRP20; Splicing factor, arginine/serine-rich 3 &gt; Serine/arginine-rich splicing factor 3; Pre-mRNA-splicing factor SRP20; Protein X16; Splicing factor, arginine/serine-rich 3 &gt; Serine/arginine-rich splicing factor 3; Splicing factor, arginine/serine-rich 3